MESLFPCPYLPRPERNLDWRHLQQCGRDRGPVFYLRCLEYAQHLWLNETPARSLLAIDRALFAELKGGEDQLSLWPLPYAGVVWIIRHAPRSAFIGNPRVHFQHLADRISDSDREIKKWRAWACWHLVRKTRPELKGDPKHQVDPPSKRSVTNALEHHGIPGESDLWGSILRGQKVTGIDQIYL